MNELFPGLVVVVSDAMPPGVILAVETRQIVEPAPSVWPWHALTVTRTIRAVGAITDIGMDGE